MKDEVSPRRRQLIDAAADVFYEKGYGAASVQDVADRVGLLKGSVYHYIRTKEDLLFAVVEEAHSASGAITENLRARALDPTEELDAFVRAHLALLFEERVKVGVYLHDFRSLTEAHYVEVASKRRDYSTYVTDLIKRGQESGEFAAPGAPEMMTLAILGMLNWTYEWYREGQTSRRSVVDEFAQAALRVVGAQPLDG